MAYTYTLTLTYGEILCICDFARGRYEYGDVIYNLLETEPDSKDDVTIQLSESDAWELHSAIMSDTDNMRTSIPLADDAFASKLWQFCSEVI